MGWNGHKTNDFGWWFLDDLDDFNDFRWFWMVICGNRETRDLNLPIYLYQLAFQWAQKLIQNHLFLSSSEFRMIRSRWPTAPAPVTAAAAGAAHRSHRRPIPTRWWREMGLGPKDPKVLGLSETRYPTILMVYHQFPHWNWYKREYLMV